MKKVVFICKGNIFPSQVAQAFYNQLIKDDSVGLSYGTSVEKENEQERKLSSYSELKILFFNLEKYNLDISNEVPRQIKEEHLNGVHKIVLMAEKEFIPQWLEKYEYEYWEIPNPEVYVNEEIKDIIKLIGGKVLNLINELDSSRPQTLIK